MSKWVSIAIVASVLVFTGVALANTNTQRFGFGRTPTAAEINGWNIDVRGTDGKGLPPGSGSVSHGEDVYGANCSSCHGDFGEGNGRMPVLAGGRGTLNTDQPMQTVGSYWPYAPTLFDYIRRAMPFPKPESLSNDDVYAVTAYVLYLNNIVPQNTVLDAKKLAAIKMPNRNGFVRDPRPDVHNVACMHNCKATPVVITADASKYQVTPDTPEPAQAPQAPQAAQAAPPAPAVPFAQAQHIIATRCAVCHAAKPTEAGITAAPMGVLLDTPEHIKQYLGRIKALAVKSNQMPVGNITNMTAAERATLGHWIDAGAPMK